MSEDLGSPEWPSPVHKPKVKPAPTVDPSPRAANTLAGMDFTAGRGYAQPPPWYVTNNRFDEITREIERLERLGAERARQEHAERVRRIGEATRRNEERWMRERLTGPPPPPFERDVPRRVRNEDTGIVEVEWGPKPTETKKRKRRKGRKIKRGTSNGGPR